MRHVFYCTYITYVLNVCHCGCSLKQDRTFMGEPEPEAEESPGFASADEGLAEDFARLSVQPSAKARPRDSQVAALSAGSQSLHRPPRDSVRIGTFVGRELTNPRVPGEEGLRLLYRGLCNLYPQRPGRPELRIYVVWVVPRYTGELDLAGLHLGLDIRAYGAILEANQGEFTGLRFRRVQDLVAGRRALLREAAVHRIGEGAEDRLFWWE